MLCGEEVPLQGHICAFFSSDEEKYAALAPFFHETLHAGDRIVNVVDGETRLAHLEELRARGVPVDEAMRDGRLSVGVTEETYLRDGELQLEGVLDMVRDAMAQAALEHRCIRTCGEMNWIGRSEGATRDAMEYEARVNYLLGDGVCTLLCVYDPQQLPSGVISDILATHQYAIVNGRLRRNPNYVKPDDYLAMLRGRVNSAPPG